MSENIGTRILQVRKDAGLIQSEFAESLGVTQSAISSLEIGINNNPTYDMLCAICNIYKVRAQWLLLGIGEVYTKESVLDLNTRELIEYQRKEIAYLKKQIQDFLVNQNAN